MPRHTDAILVARVLGVRGGPTPYEDTFLLLFPLSQKLPVSYQRPSPVVIVVVCFATTFTPFGSSLVVVLQQPRSCRGLRTGVKYDSTGPLGRALLIEQTSTGKAGVILAINYSCSPGPNDSREPHPRAPTRLTVAQWGGARRGVNESVQPSGKYQIYLPLLSRTISLCTFPLWVIFLPLLFSPSLYRSVSPLPYSLFFFPLSVTVSDFLCSLFHCFSVVLVLHPPLSL